MADSYTTSNRLEKMEPGQYLDTWGARWNAQGGSDLIDASLDGVEDFALSGSKTLTNNNGAADEARKRGLNITGGTGGTITIPNVDKLYFVRNNSSGDVVITTGSGTTATIKTGVNKWVMCNGANNVYADSGPDFGAANIVTTGSGTFGSISTVGTLASGAQTVTGAVTVSGAVNAGQYVRSTVGTGTIAVEANTGGPNYITSGVFGLWPSSTQLMQLRASQVDVNLSGTVMATFTSTECRFAVSTTASAANAFIDSASNNRLLRSTSSRRYKTSIKDIPLAECLRIVRALHSISYTSRSSSDDAAKVFYGFIAEEVATISIHLVHWTTLTDDVEIDVDTPTLEGPTGETLIPDGVMYDRIGVIQNKVLNHTLDRIEVLEAA